jgi:hypothetical protein
MSITGYADTRLLVVRKDGTIEGVLERSSDPEYYEVHSTPGAQWYGQRGHRMGLIFEHDGKDVLYEMPEVVNDFDPDANGTTEPCRMSLATREIVG